nr:2-oxoacid:ferredoxin oxidoreductase subunit beta [Actinomycetota bacterium]
GSAFIEIYQNCNIFNDGAFLALTSKDGRTTNRIYLEHGKAIRFGPDHAKGVRMTSSGQLEIVDVAEVGEDALVVHDEHRDDAGLAFALSRLASGPTKPTPLGVFRQVERPVYGDAMEEQLRAAAAKQGPGDLAKLLSSGDTWTVN